MKAFCTGVISRILVGLLIMLSAVPLHLLLWLSKGVAFLVGQVFQYRRAVVTANLQRSFPDKSPAEIATIRRQFYLHLSDLFFETISLFGAPRKAIKKRFDPDQQGLALLESFYAEGRSVICLMGHQGNWEQLPACLNFFSRGLLAIYKPLRNKAFDNFLASIRSRFAAGIVTDRQVARALRNLQKENKHIAIGLVSDQSPGNQDLVWLDFMNQDTAVYKGPERLARMFDLPVVFLYTQKIKRGRYQVKVDLIAAHPKTLDDGEITRRYMDMLEREIRRNPPHYLWSHRRWKKKRGREGVRERGRA